MPRPRKWTYRVRPIEGVGRPSMYGKRATLYGKWRVVSEHATGYDAAETMRTKFSGLYDRAVFWGPERMTDRMGNWGRDLTTAGNPSRRWRVAR